MADKKLIKRRLTALAAAAAIASPIALFAGSAAAQFFPFFGSPYQQPPAMQERPQPPADYSRAPAAKKPETPPTSNVVVMGDAMADWLAYGLEEAFADTPELGVVRKVKRDAGLIRYDAKGDLEWSSVARDVLTTEKPAVAVMILGLNDRISIRERPGAKPAAAPAAQQATPDAENPEQQIIAPEAPKGKPASGAFRSEVWAELYSKRIADTIAAMKSKGVPVIWVGLPIIRGANATSDAMYLNELYRAQAEKAGAIYVDVWEGFVDEGGKFMSTGPDVEGQTRRLRAPDGVYFTKFGARKLAHYVEREIRRVISATAMPVSLPLDVQPTSKQENVARPVTGAVIPLTAGAAPTSEELLGGGAPRTSPTDPIANRVLVKGEPISALKGRADDFIWQKGSGADLPAANMTAEPGTITPQEIPTAEQQAEQKAKSEAQAANQQPKKPAPQQQRPPAPPVQAQPAQRPFFSPFSFFR